MLASLEWVYWEALSLVVGTLGPVPLSIHTIPTQITMLAFMLPLGLGIALSVRIGATLPQNVQRAKTLTLACVVASVVLLGGLSVALYLLRESFVGLFTSELDVMEGCREIWLDVCWFNFILSFFGINMGIATGLGMQWTLGWVTVVFMWILGLPATYYFAVVKGWGVAAAWKTIWSPYLGINVVLMVAFLWKDWDALSESIRLREGMEKKSELEGLSLFVDYGSTKDETKPLV